MKKVSSLLFVCALGLTACNDADKTEATTTTSANDSSTFNLSEARTWINTENAKFAQGVLKGDSTTLAAYYHSEGQMLNDNDEPALKKDVAAAWGGMSRMGMKDFKLTTTDLVGNDELMAETGTYEMIGEGNTVIDKGKYVVVWKKENGEWKIYRDIANSSLPKK